MEKTILITGSNGGIGLSVAEYLLKNGARQLACHYRSGNDKISALLKKYDVDSETHLFQADLTNESDLKSMNEAINKNIGPVSSLVNIAGMSTNGMSWKLSRNQFTEVIDNNLLSAFLCTREFIPTMRTNAWGRIINFSSVVGTTGVAGASHYCAAKAGLIGLTKAMALELANKNITVNAIALGYFQYGLINDVPPEAQTQIKTRIPVARFGTADEVGSTVKFLLAEDSSYLTGQVIHLNGGLA